MGQDFAGAQSGNIKPELKDAITQLGIEFRVMTQFTSFVAVEEMVVTDGGQPRRIDVPIETPEGVKSESLGEETQGFNQFYGMRKAQTALARRRGGNVGGAGIAGGGGGGGGGGGVYPAPPNQPPTVSSVTVAAGAPTATPQPKEADALRVPSPEDQQVTQKLHSSLRVVVDKLQRKETLSSADEAGFIRNGKAEVQVWLTNKSDEALAKLKELDFEVILDKKGSSLIIGRLPIEKLEPLARLNVVRYVSPQVTK
jgi:hypothetical protein